MKAILLTFFLAAIIAVPFQLEAQQKEVIAEKGDGIYTLLTRHGLSASTYLNAFIELNKNILGKDNTLFAGTKYKLPDIAGTTTKTVVSTPSTPVKAQGKVVNHSYLGGKYANVKITGNELTGAIFYLVSGHGGPDPGAVGKLYNQQMCEDEYAYDITLRLARNLIQNGATIYLITRDPNDGIRDESYLRPDKDEVCYPNLTIPLNQLKRLAQRTDAVNKLYGQNKKAFQRMVSIHIDSRSRGENIDVFFYHDKRSNTGERAAKILQKTFQSKYKEHQPGRGYHGTVSTRSLYEVRNSYPTAVYIELGNINHVRDQQRFIIVDNRQAVANWLTQGFITDFKTNK